LRPIWIFTPDFDSASAWASVLTEMNSTPPELVLDHPVDGVATAPADADDLHARGLNAALFELKNHDWFPRALLRRSPGATA